MDLVDRFLHAKDQVSRALTQKKGEKIRLMVVSKGQSSEAIEALIKAGAEEFGENRFQEARDKWDVLRSRYPSVRLSFIGSLQSNKIKEIGAFFDGIHSLYKVKHLDRLAQMEAHHLELMVEVNLAGEVQKAGLLSQQMSDFLSVAQERHLPIHGVMGIPPVGVEPIPYFKCLKSLADNYDLPEVSMGMSGDFEKAIACGATIVRIGSLIFCTHGEG